MATIIVEDGEELQLLLGGELYTVCVNTEEFEGKIAFVKEDEVVYHTEFVPDDDGDDDDEDSEESDEDDGDDEDDTEVDDSEDDDHENEVEDDHLPQDDAELNEDDAGPAKS